MDIHPMRTGMLIRRARWIWVLARYVKGEDIKGKLLTAAILLAIGIGALVWLVKCPSKVEILIGSYESKDAGLRAAIKTLAHVVNRCPAAKTYRIIWSGPDPDENQRVDRRALLYFREPKVLGYEHDVYSGIAGRKYIVNDEAVRAIAEKAGTLADFAEYDQSPK